MHTIFGFLCRGTSLKVLCEASKLFSESHHELWVAVNLINQLREHWNELFDAAFGAKQVGNLTQPLDRVHLGVRVLT